MNREIKERTILDTFAEDFVNVVEKHTKYVIVSGFVAIAHGRSRGTEDVDIIIERIKKDAFIKMHNDFLQAKDELDDYQIRTRKELPLTGLELYFSSIEMNIAFKEELLRSEKDMDDAKHLRIIYSDVLDENEITKIKADIRRLRLS